MTLVSDLKAFVVFTCSICLSKHWEARRLCRNMSTPPKEVLLNAIRAILTHRGRTRSQDFPGALKSGIDKHTSKNVAQLDGLLADVLASMHEGSNPRVRDSVGSCTDDMEDSLTRLVNIIAADTPEQPEIPTSSVSPSTDSSGVRRLQSCVPRSNETQDVSTRMDTLHSSALNPVGQTLDQGPQRSTQDISGAPSYSFDKQSLVSADTLDAIAPFAAQPRKKRYRKPIPSTHCHICCRPSRSVSVVVCANIADGLCRKTICNLCISEYDLGNWETITKPNSGWQCTHCLNGCSKVPRAQCFVYARTNLKRKMASANKRRMKAELGTNVAASSAVKAWAERAKERHLDKGDRTE